MVNTGISTVGHNARAESCILGQAELCCSGCKLMLMQVAELQSLLQARSLKLSD